MAKGMLCGHGDTNVWDSVRRLADDERTLDAEVSEYLSVDRPLKRNEQATMYMHLLFILYAFTQYSRDERWANMVIGDSSLASADDKLRTRMYIDDDKWCCELAYRDKYGGKRLATREYNGLWKRVIDRSLVLVPRSYLFASFNDPAMPMELDYFRELFEAHPVSTRSIEADMFMEAYIEFDFFVKEPDNLLDRSKCALYMGHSVGVAMLVYEKKL